MLKIEVDGDYLFPTPDWFLTNASWAAEQLQIYKDNRTGKPHRRERRNEPQVVTAQVQ
jgi:hypothetical protein